MRLKTQIFWQIAPLISELKSEKKSEIKEIEVQITPKDNFGGPNPLPKKNCN